MRIEIIGFKSISANKAEVTFKTGKKCIYDSEKTEQLFLPLSEIEQIQILKENK